MGMAGLRSGLTCASRTFFLQGQAIEGKEQGGVPPHDRSGRSDNKKRAGPVQRPPGHHDAEPWRCISRCGQFHCITVVKPGIHLPTFPQVFFPLHRLLLACLPPYLLVCLPAVIALPRTEPTPDRAAITLHRKSDIALIHMYKYVHKAGPRGSWNQYFSSPHLAIRRCFSILGSEGSKPC